MNSTSDRKVQVFLPEGGKAKIRLNGNEWPLSKGDGALGSDVDARDDVSRATFSLEPIGCEEGEVAVLDVNLN